jgi:TRAP-type C4-dicarboxylate transport system permease small subunit
MTTTAQPVSATIATDRSDERRTFPRALVVALIALAALTIAVVTWQLTATTSTTTPVDSVPKAAADQLAPYRPGGSVYQQQVPKAAS